MPDETSLTNCFYAPLLTRREKDRLKVCSKDGIDELNLLRAFALRLAGQLSQLSPAEYSDHDLKLLIQLVRIGSVICMLLRGNFTIQGKDASADKEIEAALEAIGEDWSKA